MSYYDDLRVLVEDAPIIKPGTIQRIYQQRAGFFTPYSNLADFSSTLTAPILDTLVLGLAGTAYTAVAALLFGVSSLLAAGSVCNYLVVGCFPRENIRATAVTLELGLVALGLALVNTAVAIFSIFYNTAALLSRTASSIVFPIINSDSHAADVPEQIEMRSMA